jgi:hypothetical protein
MELPDSGYTCFRPQKQDFPFAYGGNPPILGIALLPLNHEWPVHGIA